MRRPFVPFSGSATSHHKRSSVGFITATFGLRFLVHTLPHDFAAHFQAEVVCRVDRNANQDSSISRVRERDATHYQSLMALE